jgi:ATP-dependent Clp protease ATP-binding subunit ClpC
MGISIELSDSVKNMLVEQGYDPNLGARPLRRAVQRFIEDPLSEEMLLGRFQSGDRILADTEDGKLVIFKRLSDEPDPEASEPEKELVS